MAATRGKKGVQGQKIRAKREKQKKDGEGGILARSHTATPSRLPQDPKTDSKQKRFRSSCVPEMRWTETPISMTRIRNTKREGGAHLTKSSCSRKQLAPTPTRVLWWYTDERKKQKKHG